MKSASRCLSLIVLLLAIPIGAFAQRDVKMFVSYINPNPYPLTVRFTAIHKAGQLDCDRDPRDILKIAANGVVRIVCTAKAQEEEHRYGFRHLDLSWHAGIDRLGRPAAAALLEVFGGHHKFRCTRGCSVTESWNCGSSGPCSTTVVVTMDRWETSPE